MAHRGIREFSGEELSSVALGQNGFKIVANGSTVITGGNLAGETATAGYENIEYFVALKVIDADCELEARSYLLSSDDFTTNSGTYNGSSPQTVLNGDIIYGAFDKVKAATAGYVICYIGRST